MKFGSLCILSALLLLCCSTLGFAELNTEKNITLHLSGKSFSEVAVLVSQQSECAVEYDESWENIVVSGDFVDISIERFFGRILKDKNVVIEISNVNKTIHVKSFGEKTTKMITANYRTSNRGNGKSSEAIDPMTGKSMAEIAMINKSLKDRREKQLQDPSTIDPMTGRTLGNVNDNLEQQEKSRLLTLNDYNAMDPMTGETIGDVNRNREKLEEDRAISLQNPHTIDPMTGKTISEVNTRHELQVQTRAEQLKNPAAIDPMTGNTFEEVDAILRQQEARRGRGIAE